MKGVPRRSSTVFAVCLILLGWSPSSAPASSSARAMRTYEVHDVSASWEVSRRNGTSRLYRIEGARYEDVETHEVMRFAVALWMNCDRKGLCGGGPEDFEERRGKVRRFEFASDLSSAAIAFRARRRIYRAEWVPVDPLERPLEYLPRTFGRSEWCNDREGSGEGLSRRMQAEGSLFGRRFDSDNNGSFTRIASYTLTTECDPRDWWSARMEALRSAGEIPA